MNINHNFLQNEIEKNEMLGQIFTKKIVSDYMVSLLTIPTEGKILDPCFGEGVFIESALKQGFKNITGFEIDPLLFNNVKKKHRELDLLNIDFLCSRQNEKYDGIIMNPPYIRQEKINDLNPFGITKERIRENEMFSILPRTANLYMYFIIKAISLLSNSGELIVIFPSSWLSASNGNRFKEYLFSSCALADQVHISGQVFKKNALVDVVIMKLIKGSIDIKTNRRNYIIKNGEFIQHSTVGKIPDFGLNVPFSELASARRGLTTGYNKMFINPNVTKGISKKYTKKVLSTPKYVKGYNTNNAITDKILMINDDIELPRELGLYIEKWERIILMEKHPKTLFNKIQKGLVWYKLNSIDCSGILFSYIIRNDMKFILNDAELLARDNFYVINPIIDKLLMISLLNNYYIYLQLEKLGKKYGAGLLKIQRYDLDKLVFPDLGQMSERDIDRLRHYGKQLHQNGDKAIIDDISKLLSNYTKADYTLVKKLYEAEKNHRLVNNEN